ncbi:hypothetical protein PHMEG_0009584 [Phytophthora megakarya]|uniref:Uncharacterized protein n=1 Tax=Phytophthora megakarya TaxID=4795 RepID=A0A225WIB0_9STRA|nr:hypothetical protein PHMEG_0009584 [Phytophthora megakarya]
MFSRWAGQPTKTVNLKRFTRSRSKKKQLDVKTNDPSDLRPLDAEGFTWLTLAELRSSQQQHQAPASAIPGKDKVLRVDQRIWVPHACADFAQRLCVIAHCGRKATVKRRRWSTICGNCFTSLTCETS